MQARDDDAKRTTVGCRTQPSTVLPAGSRVLAVSLALLLASIAWTPLAVADSTEHWMCIGDSDAVRNRTPGSGCARGWMETWIDCSGSRDTYRCTLFGTMAVETTGVATCGNTSSFWFANNTTAACTRSTDHRLEAERTVTEQIANYTADEIPPHGRTVVVNATTCAWPEEYNASRACASFNHTEHVPGDPTGPYDGTIDFLGTILAGQAEYLVDTVDNSTIPVSVHP